jgi:hypothetical protein
MTATIVGEDLALLSACWRSIGLRGAVVEWELDRPARMQGSLAMRLRSALGPALEAAGVRPSTLRSIPGDSRPPASWFLGWDCPPVPVRTVRAGLRCVGSAAADWPELRAALCRLRLPAAGQPGVLAHTVGCRISWDGEGVTEAGAFGPPMVEEPALDLDGGACLVEAVTPLHLRIRGREITGPPPFEVLVRSAGERMRQLCLHWGSGAESLPPVIGRAYWEAAEARFAWARTAGQVEVKRRSSSTGQVQVVRGMVGVFAYEEVSPLAMAVLALGSELGVGKDTAFGCGQVAVHGAQTG